MTIGARPRLISSNRIRSGLDISARPIATICCWPPESAVRGRVAALREDREEAVDRLQRPRALAAELAADEEVLLDRERRKEPPALRHQRDAALHDLRRGEAADRLAAVAHHLRLDADQAGDRLEQRALAGAVGADQRQHLALAERRRRCRTAPGNRRRRRRARRPRGSAQASRLDPHVDLGDLRRWPSPPSGRPRRSSCRNR